jgi:hypothetical protein
MNQVVKKRRENSYRGGGFASKIHARADGQGRSLGFTLTGGEASDYQAVEDLRVYPSASPVLCSPIRAMIAMLFEKIFSSTRPGGNGRQASDSAIMFWPLLPTPVQQDDKGVGAAVKFRLTVLHVSELPG